MRGMKLTVLVLVAVFLFGCAQINFNSKDKDGKGLTYYETQPYLLVNTTADCVSTISLLILPGAKKIMLFERGYGSAKLSVTLSNGMITSAGQETDTKIPETITSIATLGTSINGIVKANQECAAGVGAKLYPIVDGVISDKPSFTILKQ